MYAASGGNLADLQRLAELDLILLGESEIWRDPLENIIVPPAEAPALTPEQAEALAQVKDRVWLRLRLAKKCCPACCTA